MKETYGCFELRYYGKAQRQKNTTLTTRISWMPWRIISLLFNEKQRRMELQKECIKDWKEKPPIPRYIGECFLKMANRLSFKPNFVNYMFKDDMICDGIENCVRYMHNFDSEKSKNPFAYFTQIIYFAFLRRISMEKKQLEIKNKILEKTDFDEVFDANVLTVTTGVITIPSRMRSQQVGYQ